MMKLNSLTMLDGSMKSLLLPQLELGARPPNRAGELAKIANYVCVGRYVSGSLAWVEMAQVELPPVLYDFTAHTFTNVGNQGPIGPTITQARNAYSAAPWAANDAYFNVNAGIQIWTVPETAIYRIVARGACGARATSSSSSISRPTRMGIEVALRAGEKLQILVGQCPGNIGGTPTLKGGGGGTFVQSDRSGLLVVAGGAGANSSASDGNGNAGAAITARQRIVDSNFGKAGGTVGNNSLGYVSQGGAGYSGNSVANVQGGVAPFAFLNGGNGGVISGLGTTSGGGFGGGGAAGRNNATVGTISAAGGGYEGGRGDSGNPQGGTSFTADGVSVVISEVMSVSLNGGIHGSVVITKL